jgi:hypothetical protein
MVVTEGRQWEIIHIRALEFFGACSGQSQLAFGELMGVECELSFTAGISDYKVRRSHLKMASER